jgi:hypothetical protein
LEEEFREVEILEGQIEKSLSERIAALLDRQWPSESLALINALENRDPSGLSDADVYEMLLQEGSRWGFTKESEFLSLPTPGPSKEIEVKQTFELIPYQREPIKVYTVQELLNSDFEVEWIMENLFTEQGIISFNGEPDIGKTQNALRWLFALATGGEYLGYRVIGGPRKVVFISLEMAEGEVKRLIKTMRSNLSKREKELLEENLLLLPFGEQLLLNESNDRIEYWRILQEFKPDGILIDSWSQAVEGDLSSDVVVRGAFSFLNVIRKYFQCFIGIINHTRKSNDTSGVRSKMDDVYGSRFFISLCSAALVFCKHKGQSDIIEVHQVKNRFGKKMTEPLIIRRIEECLDFMIDPKSIDAVVALTPKRKLTPAQKRKEENTAKMNKTLGELLGLDGDFKFYPPPEITPPENFDPKLLEETDGDIVPGFEL